MRVVIAGGGIAAMEALAGLRALAGDRVDATLLAPLDTFSYRPLSTAVPFTFRAERSRSLAELAEGLEARFVQDGLTHVDQQRRRVLTRDGDFLPYDTLLVAIGARVGRAARPRLTWSRGREGESMIASLLRDLAAGSIRSLAFVVPPGTAWPMDAYELSLIARRQQPDARVALVTAEERPLEALGPVASEAVAAELERVGIEVFTGVKVGEPGSRGEAGAADAFTAAVARVSGQGRDRRPRRVVLHLEPGSPLAVDRAVFLPSVHGPDISGLPHDRRGFIPVDRHARVAGSSGVYAAGDATALSIKHSTLSAGQGTAAAEAMAAAAGADVAPAPWSGALYGVIALPPHFPGAGGSPWLDDGEPAMNCLWWPPGHVSGRYLAPYLAARDPGVRPGLEWHPNGIPVAAPLGAGASEAGPAASPSEEALAHDALSRQLMAIRRAEKQGERLERELDHGLAEFDRHEQAVIEKLESAGYLRGDSPPRATSRGAGR